MAKALFSRQTGNRQTKASCRVPAQEGSGTRCERPARLPPDTPDTPSDTGEFGTGENEIADLNAIQFIRLWFVGVWEFLKGVEIPVLKVTASAFLIALFLIGLVINLVGYIIGVQFGTIDLPSTAKTFNQRGGNNGRYKISDKRKKDRF